MRLWKTTGRHACYEPGHQLKVIKLKLKANSDKIDDRYVKRVLADYRKKAK